MSARHDEFERVAMPHTRSLLRVARRLTTNVAAAEDLVQETLLLAWRRFNQFEPGTNARAWLFQILFNAFRAQGRRSRTMPDLVQLTDDLESSRRNPDDALEIIRALESLEIEHRVVLLLGVVEGFTCREMADILSIPIGTVMSRLSRARHAMRLRLDGRCEASPGPLAKVECTGKEIR